MLAGPIVEVDTAKVEGPIQERHWNSYVVLPLRFSPRSYVCAFWEDQKNEERWRE